ncbi:hypothetical protein MFLAVUS_004937 [Mucor flavus]|uniref:Uncharacterized protein n=1 Tax=Mucor flavus TaxID=439312 RepID=A0ABP9YXA2_9FUNG
MNSIKDLINKITTAFLDIGTLKDNDIETREIIAQCHEVYKTLYYQTRDISQEYSKADERLDRIQLELSIANSKEVLNISIIDDIKDDTFYLLRILDNNKEKTTDIQNKTVKCRSKTESQIKYLKKNSPGVGNLQEIFQTFSNGIEFSLVTGAAGPISLICVTNLYAAVSRFSHYYARKEKKSSLSKALNNILGLLDTLLDKADAFNVSHTKALVGLNKYLRSIDNMVKRSLHEGPLSHPVLVDNMLRKTESIKTTFENMTTLAKTNTEIFRKELLYINPKSIIDS